MRRYLEPYRGAARHLRGRAARPRPHRPATTRASPFSMPVLAIHTSDHYNGVSELHGEVSRKMWQGLWPELPDARGPHRVDHQRRAHRVVGRVARWARSSRATSARAGPSSATTPSSGRAPHEIPDAELWQVHEHRRHRLVQHARRWLRAAAERRGAPARGARAGRRGARPARAHDRLRAALRDLQAGDAALHATSSASRSSSATRSARCSSSSPARRTRRTAAARSSFARSSTPSRDAGPARARRLPRGLRHAHGARAGERRRRVAQHAAPPATRRAARAG